MGVRHMQGVSAHLEYLSCKEKRRHLSRCKYIIKPQKICDCVTSGYFQERCGGSSHCNFYEENHSIRRI